MTRIIEEPERRLKDALLEMGTTTERMVETAVDALLTRSAQRLEEVQEDERRVNAMHIDIDERCFTMIALHQPAAADLRMAMAAIKINSDLERIGDQAINVAETTKRLLAQPALKGRSLEIPRMADLAREMLRDSLKAFVHGDVALARAVIARDDAEDELKSRAFEDLIALMRSDPATIEAAFGLVLIARNLERIADHATNIAEDVVFMVLGKDIRHGGA